MPRRPCLLGELFNKTLCRSSSKRNSSLTRPVCRQSNVRACLKCLKSCCISNKTIVIDFSVTCNELLVASLSHLRSRTIRVKTAERMCGCHLLGKYCSREGCNENGWALYLVLNRYTVCPKVDTLVRVQTEKNVCRGETHRPTDVFHGLTRKSFIKQPHEQLPSDMQVWKDRSLEGGPGGGPGVTFVTVGFIFYAWRNKRRSGPRL